MFADWTDRIAAGEVPPVPPRPQGIERNIVLSIWDFASDKAFVHDIVASNQWDPTVNAYGPIYGGDYLARQARIRRSQPNSPRAACRLR